MHSARTHGNVPPSDTDSSSLNMAKPRRSAQHSDSLADIKSAASAMVRATTYGSLQPWSGPQLTDEVTMCINAF